VSSYTDVSKHRFQTFNLWVNPKASPYFIAIGALEHASMLTSDWSVGDRFDWGGMQFLSVRLLKVAVSLASVKWSLLYRCQ
jgi:hypothetical protein